MLTKFIKELTEQDNKNLSQKALKVCEEAGELAKVVLPFDNADGTLHRFVDKHKILEEVADVYLTAISVAYDLGFTDDEINDMIDTKAKKWADLQRHENKVNEKIPFEIHVTVQAADTDIFREVCKKLDVKPIILDLQTKNKTIIKDIMSSSTHMGTNRSAYEEMKRISHGLAMEGYDVVREKIETVPWHPAAPSNDSEKSMPKNCYFETHIGVNVLNENRKKYLESVVGLFDAHMSRNAFKVHDDGSWMQMVTMRWYKGTREHFEREADALYKTIQNHGFDVEKRITEFSIYDTKVSHDFEWLRK
jgi:hypothetical protein